MFVFIKWERVRRCGLLLFLFFRDFLTIAFYCFLIIYFMLIKATTRRWGSPPRCCSSFWLLWKMILFVGLKLWWPNSTSACTTDSGGARWYNEQGGKSSDSSTIFETAALPNDIGGTSVYETTIKSQFLASLTRSLSSSSPLPISP